MKRRKFTREFKLEAVRQASQAAGQGSAGAPIEPKMRRTSS
jgi:transposase-like protein